MRIRSTDNGQYTWEKSHAEENTGEAVTEYGESPYRNPVMEHYEVEGQMSLEDFLTI